MNPPDFYYHLQPNPTDSCSMDPAAGSVAGKIWLCRGCHYPKRGVQEVHVTIQARPQGRGPLDFVYGYGILLVRQTLAGPLIREGLARDLYFGQVSSDTGDVLEDWLTVRGKERLIVRGSEHVAHRRCDECGRNVYFAMGPRYLFPPPPDGCGIFESCPTGLIVTPALLDSLNVRDLPHLAIKKIPVRSAPEDGLTDMVSFYAQEESREE